MSVGCLSTTHFFLIFGGPDGTSIRLIYNILLFIKVKSFLIQANLFSEFWLFRSISIFGLNFLKNNLMICLVEYYSVGFRASF